MIICSTQVAAGLWGHVSLEKCHLSPHGVCSYTDGAQELVGEAEKCKFRTPAWGGVHANRVATLACNSLKQKSEAASTTFWVCEAELGI